MTSCDLCNHQTKSALLDMYKHTLNWYIIVPTEIEILCLDRLTKILHY